MIGIFRGTILNMPDRRGFLFRSLLFFLFVSIVFSCRKNDEDEIPYVLVNFDVSLTDPSFTDLNAVGGWVYVTGGVRGIIIYRKSVDEFLAHERNCPYKPNDNCARVSVDSTNFFAADACCGSRFTLSDGGVAQGPAVRPLKQYNAILNGTNLRIQN